MLATFSLPKAYKLVGIRPHPTGSEERWPAWYAKAVKWFADEDEAFAEADRLNEESPGSPDLCVYFVGHPKKGKPKPRD